jgi:hypothetical protein
MYNGPPVEKEKLIQQDKERQKVAREQMPPRNPYQGGYNPQPTQNPLSKVDIQA